MASINDGTTAQAPREALAILVLSMKSFFFSVWILCITSSVLKLLTLSEVSGCQLTFKSLWQIISDELIIFIHNVNTGRP